MSIEKKIESALDETKLSERIGERARRAKEHESAAIHAARDAAVRGSEHAERILHRATDATADAASRVGERAMEFGEHGREQWEKGRDSVEDAFGRMLDYVRDNPGKSLAVAAAGGWLLGSILRRR